jgi:adenine phosphoribosyltransferase
LLRDVETFQLAINTLVEHYLDKPIDVITGMESRGFIVGVPLAIALSKPFVMLRKPNKLPGEKIFVDYGIEYGKDRLEVQIDAFKPNENVLIVDDLLATGGTAAAAATLVEKLGANVYGYGFLIELSDLNGKQKLSTSTREVFSLVSF